MNNINVQNSLYLSPTDNQEILKIISDLKMKKSSGNDNINSILVKKIKLGLLEPLQASLQILINRSLEEGIFPQRLKISKVIPVYKNNEKASMHNYRPISLLSIFSKRPLLVGK